MAEPKEKKRRGKGEGSIFQRKDGRYAGQCDLGTDPLTGKRIRKTFYGKTKAEVLKAMREAQHSLEQGTDLQASKLTVADHFSQWINYLQSIKTKPRTLENYGFVTSQYLNPFVGKKKLSDLKPVEIQRVYTALVERGLSHSTVHNTHRVLKAALRYAVKLGILTRCAADVVTPPKLQRKEFQVLNKEQLHRFLDSAREDSRYALYLTAATTGMRQGELLALRWEEDVDLNRGAIHVRQTLVRKTKTPQPVFDTPKSRASRRKITLPETTVKALKRHKALQAQERLASGAEYQDYGLVFAQSNGLPLNGQYISKKAFKRLLRKADLPDIRFYDLRHTHATLLLLAGVHPKIVQERLGHSSIALTLDTYSHVLPEMQKEAAEKIDDLLAAPWEKQS